jgi:GT2 family glycosyltransferase
MPAGNSMAVVLSASIVTYAPDMEVLDQTLVSLQRALGAAHARGVLASATVSVIDNGPGDRWREPLRALLGRTCGDAPWLNVEVVSGHGNVGYGRGHNLALLRTSADYHLVLNPDVIVQDDAVHAAIAYLQAHGEAGLLAPRVSGPDGRPEYLCKRYPTLLDLTLRGFAPRSIRNLFRARLDSYEMKVETDSDVVFNAPLASGCCMFLRREPAQTIGGFCDDFFMYFEDFDLSVRLSRVARIVCVPAVRIVHLGGNAARKGLRHIFMFAQSGWIFFARHGWRIR